MPTDKPWSAPAHGLQMQDQSRKMKFARIRSNATKTIEEWAREGRSSAQPEVSIGRKSGTQLSDNVTEERMLQARLMELSKERYKFIHQIQYEKKMFLDRQQRKSAALREKLKNVKSESNNNRLRSWSANDLSAARKPNSTTVGSSRGGPMSRTSQQHNSRSARSCPRQPQQLQQQQQAEELKRPQTVPPRLGEQQQHDAAAARPIFSTEPPIEETKYTGPGRGGLPRLTTPIRAATTVKFVDKEQDEAAIAPSPSPSPSKRPIHRRRKCSKGSIWSRAAGGQLRPTSVSQPKGPTHDHRYKDLEGCLCENYELQKETEAIPDIIEKCEALHVKAKRPREARPKIALKAYQFLVQRESDLGLST